MSHSELCLVCNGAGKIHKYETEEDKKSTATPRVKKTCHGCNGKGWITVGIEYPIPKVPEYYFKPYTWRPETTTVSHDTIWYDTNHAQKWIYPDLSNS